MPKVTNKKNFSGRSANGQQRKKKSHTTLQHSSSSQTPMPSVPGSTITQTPIILGPVISSNFDIPEQAKPMIRSMSEAISNSDEFHKSIYRMMFLQNEEEAIDNRVSIIDNSFASHASTVTLNERESLVQRKKEVKDLLFVSERNLMMSVVRPVVTSGVESGLRKKLLPSYEQKSLPLPPALERMDVSH